MRKEGIKILYVCALFESILGFANLFERNYLEGLDCFASAYLIAWIALLQTEINELRQN